MRNANGAYEVLYFEVMNIKEVIKKEMPYLDAEGVDCAYYRCEIPYDFSELELYQQEIAIAGAKHGVADTMNVTVDNIRTITKEEYENVSKYFDACEQYHQNKKDDNE